MEQMEGIRDQQESLARLHFELTTKQDLTQPMSEDGKNVSFVLYLHLIPVLGYNLMVGFEPSQLLKYNLLSTKGCK